MRAGEIAADLERAQRYRLGGVRFHEMTAGVIDDVPGRGSLEPPAHVLGQQGLREVAVEVAAEGFVGVLQNQRAGRIHHLSSGGGKASAPTGLGIGLGHDVEGRLFD